MCETGTIDSAETRGNGVGEHLLGRSSPRTRKPGEQVPRIPSGSQVPVCSSSSCSLRASTTTWSLGSASGARRNVTNRSSA